MNVKLISTLIGLIVGITLLFLNPNLIEISADLNQTILENTSGTSIKSGSPLGLGITFIPILTSITGYFIGSIFIKKPKE